MYNAETQEAIREVTEDIDCLNTQISMQYNKIRVLQKERDELMFKRGVLKQNVQ